MAGTGPATSDGSNDHSERSVRAHLRADAGYRPNDADQRQQPSTDGCKVWSADTYECKHLHITRCVSDAQARLLAGLAEHR